MKRIRVHKAQGMLEPVESLTILVIKEIPEIKSFDKANKMFNVDAEAIVNSLLEALPRGTTDRVLAKLMMRKATSLIIPFNS
jgi:hypothetical protein